MKNKKAQMKIQQMAFMLIAVTLFFVMVGLFVLTVQLSELRGSAESLEERNAMLLVSKLANSPEFACGSAFGGSRINCVDSDKVMMLRENINLYSGFWGIDGIEVRKLYPLEDFTECDLDNYPNCNLIRIHGNEVSSEFSNFVSLCRKEVIQGSSRPENVCEIAKLTVSYGGSDV